MSLVETKACPVCGGTERTPSDGMAPRKLQGLHYIKHAAAGLGIPVEEFAERAKTYRCVSCGSYYCDPWLSPELASSLFCAGAPDHIAGWSNFEYWLQPSRNLNLVEVRNHRLYAAITRRLGPLSSYAEFGCPFQGFLLQLKGCEANPAKRIDLFAKALCRDSDVRWTKIARIYNAAQRWCGRLAVLGFRLRAVLMALSAFMTRGSEKQNLKMANCHADQAGLGAASLPQRRYLLTEDTTKGWGSNCVRYGVTCRYFAHTILDADVIPMGEAHRNGSPAFDLIGMFNSLDHVAFPLETLRKCLDLTGHVLVVTHHATHAGKQHLYAFGDGFASWLQQSLKGISTEDLGKEVDIEGLRDYNYLLITQKP